MGHLQTPRIAFRDPQLGEDFAVLGAWHPARDELEVVDDARVVVSPNIADEDVGSLAQLRREVQCEILGALIVGNFEDLVERLLGYRAEELTFGAHGQVFHAGFSVIAVDGAQVHETFFVLGLHEQSEGGIAIEGNVGDAYEIRARRTKELGDDDADVFVMAFDLDVALGNGGVGASDAGLAAIAILRAHGSATVTRHTVSRKRMAELYGSSSTASLARLSSR